MLSRVIVGAAHVTFAIRLGTTIQKFIGIIHKFNEPVQKYKVGGGGTAAEGRRS